MEKFPFLSEVFDSINEGIYILNRQGDYIYCNSAFLKMVGATRDDALGLNAFRLVPEGQVSISVAVMAFEQKKKLSVINNVCTPKGYHYRQLATATPIFDSVGEIEYMLVEMVRLDLFKKRYQQAILDEDADCIEVPGLGEALADRPETFVAESQSMRALLDKRSFSVRVNPEDADLVADILSDARHVNSRVSVWETVRDPSLEPGSLVVESESALVDNSRAARFSAVDEVLSHLEIPESKADHNAAETVTRTLLHSLRGAGVDVTEEGAEPSEGSVRDSSSEDVASVEKRPEPEEDALPAASSEAAVSAADNGESGETPAETSAVSGSATEEVREETLPVPELSVRDEPESEAASSAVPGSMAETDKGGSPPVAPESAPDHGELAGTEASELVDAFLGDPGADGHPLPDIVADELLADMGFGPEKERHSNG